MHRLKPLGNLIRLLQLRQKPYRTPLPPAELLPSSELIEDERAPCYNPKHFYSVRLHEIFNDRYQVMTKLGWGTTSTVRLAKGLHEYAGPQLHFK